MLKILLYTLMLYIPVTCLGCGSATESSTESSTEDAGEGDSSAGLKTLATDRGIQIGGNYDYELKGETHDRIFEEEFNAVTVFFGEGVTYPDGSQNAVFSDTDPVISWATALG